MSADSSTTASSLDDDAVDRDDLTGAHDDEVARDDLVDRHLLERVAAAPRARRAARAETSAVSSRRARPAALLERVAAGEHQRDHRAGEVLAERERAGHRDERDRVDADVAAQQRAQHRPRQRDEHDAERSPDDVPGAGWPSRWSTPPPSTQRGRRARGSCAHANRRQIGRGGRSRSRCRRDAADDQTWRPLRSRRACATRPLRAPSANSASPVRRARAVARRARQEEVGPERDDRGDGVRAADHDASPSAVSWSTREPELLLDHRPQDRERVEWQAARPRRARRRGRARPPRRAGPISSRSGSDQPHLGPLGRDLAPEEPFSA